MLSSDQTGEVAATAAAIGRALKSGGYDWHDFAKFLGAPKPAFEQPRREYRASNDNSDAKTFRYFGFAQAMQALEAMKAEPFLSGWEKTFVASVLQQHDDNGYWRPSVRQIECMDAIFSKATNRGFSF
jgi:hypothetical protein